MPVFNRVNGVWRENVAQHDRISGAWRSSDVFDRINGVWRPCRKPIPLYYGYHTSYVGTQTVTFIANENTWYKIYCVGACVNGKNGNSLSGSGLISYKFKGGDGGNSGGLSISSLYLQTGTTVTITINTEISSFGSYMYSTAATDTDIGYGVNGNVANLSGGKGGIGGGAGDSPGGNPGANGELDGASGNWGGYSEYTNAWGGGGGGGGAKLPGSSFCPYIYQGSLSTWKGGWGGNYYSDEMSNGTNGDYYPPSIAGPSLQLYGGGNGGGGGAYGGAGQSSAGYGSAGSPGAVIIEKGVY